jgi:hypothetical protein
VASEVEEEEAEEEAVAVSVEEEVDEEVEEEGFKDGRGNLIFSTNASKRKDEQRKDATLY